MPSQDNVEKSNAQPQENVLEIPPEVKADMKADISQYSRGSKAERNALREKYVRACLTAIGRGEGDAFAKAWYHNVLIF